MVLISLLWACSVSKPVLKSPTPHDVYMLASLDKLDAARSVDVPQSLLKTLKDRVQKRGVTVKALSINERYASQRNSMQRAKLYPERPLLLIETQAQFFSQLEGRFRWTVDVRLTLYTADGTVYNRSASIPVFHQFHHQREKESLEAAEEQISRYVDRLLDDYLRGIQP